MNNTEARNTVLNFGKYKDETLQNVMYQDIKYVRWLQNIATFDKIKEALNVLSEDIEEIYNDEKFGGEEWDDIPFEYY